MDEDSPNNMLSPEEHILLFNKCKIKDGNTPTEELIATRNLMKLAIAKLRAHVQSKTVVLNERRANAKRKEKEAIIAADKMYQPRLRVEEKASPSDVKIMAEINADEKVREFLKKLPQIQRKAMVSFIKQLGIKDAKKLWGWDVSTDETPASEE